MGHNVFQSYQDTDLQKKKKIVNIWSLKVGLSVVCLCHDGPNGRDPGHSAGHRDQNAAREPTRGEDGVLLGCAPPTA